MSYFSGFACCGGDGLGVPEEGAGFCESMTTPRLSRMRRGRSPLRGVPGDSTF